MNQVENLTKKILDDAQAAAASAREKALEQVAQLNAEYLAKAEAEESAILREADEKAKATLERVQSQREVYDRNEQLAARRQCIDQAFERALELMTGLPREKRQGFIERLAAQYQSEEAVLILNAADMRDFGGAAVQAISKASGKPLSLCGEPGNFSGGFILKEGSIEINCTFEVIIREKHDQLETDAASILFG